MGRTMHSKTAELLPYVPDLRKDKFHVWIPSITTATSILEPIRITPGYVPLNSSSTVAVDPRTVSDPNHWQPVQYSDARDFVTPINIR